MSVLIEGMEMPKCCEDCRLLYDCCSCIVTGDSMAMIGWKIEEKRLPDCPLIELPDHGDLVDRDEFIGRLESWALLIAIGHGDSDEWVKCISEVCKHLYDAPVVIPAERSEE